MRLLIDTDIGDDIDDALAIAMALNAGADIVGITTVYRESAARADVVRGLLSVAGREDVPVFAGESRPIANIDYIGELNYGNSFVGSNGKESRGEAVGFIAECAEKYNDDLVILAIGAQTNLARAVLDYPDKMRKAGKIVIMGGCFKCHSNEWNIACDPTAAKIVMESDLNVEYVPWDVTRYASLGAENYARVLAYPGGGLAGFVADVVRAWSKRASYVPLLHDPLAFYSVIHPDRVKYEKIKSLVVDEGDAAGLTLNLNDYWGKARKDPRARKITVLSQANLDDVANEFMSLVFGRADERSAASDERTAAVE